jgi:hypothetical protein
MPADSVLNAIKIAFDEGFIQRIKNLTVIPRVQTAQILFQTTQPTIPIVEALEEADPSGQGKMDLVDVKFPIFSPLVKDHNIQLGSATKRLPQGTRMLARVTAPPTMFKEINPKSAVEQAWFSTLNRRATVSIDEIIIRVDGDPGGSGEMSFGLRFYDGETGQPLTSAEFVGQDNNAYDGKVIPVNRRQVIRVAPDQLVLYACGTDWDSIDIPWPGQSFSLKGIVPPPVLPEAPRKGEDDFAQWAEGLDTVNLPTFPTDNFRVTRQLDSLWGAVSFHVKYTVSCRVWSRFEDQMIIPAPKTMALKAVVAAAGEVAGARTEAGHVHLMTTTPTGDLLYRHVAPLSRDGRQSEWRPIGSAPSEYLTVHTGSDGTIHLFSPDRAGMVCHRSFSAGDAPSPDDRWERLGGDVSGPVRAATVGRSIELFALGRDGTLLHRRLDDDGDAWENLGRCPGGLVDVIASRDTVHVFAADACGRVSHKHRTDGRWLPSRRDWTGLGGGFGGPIVAATDEHGTVAVVAFTEHGEAQWQDGRWDRDHEAWQLAELPDEQADDEQDDQAEAVLQIPA